MEKILGSESCLSEQSKMNFAEAYHGDVLDNLCPWLTELVRFPFISTEHTYQFWRCRMRSITIRASSIKTLYESV